MRTAHVKPYNHHCRKRQHTVALRSALPKSHRPVKTHKKAKKKLGAAARQRRKAVLPPALALPNLRLPPASPLPCSSVPVSSRTTSRFRGLSGVRDVGLGRLDHRHHRHHRHHRRRPGSRGSLHGPRPSRGARHRGPSADDSHSSLSQRTTARENLQPPQMATGPGSECTSTSTSVPAPSARRRALERHKHPLPVTSRACFHGSRGLGVFRGSYV